MEVIESLVKLITLPFAWWFPCKFIYLAFKIFTDEYERVKFFDELNYKTEETIPAILLGLFVTCMAIYFTYILISTF